MYIAMLRIERWRNWPLITFKNWLTQKFEFEPGNVGRGLNLLIGVAHLLEDALKALSVVAGVGQVGEGFNEVTLAVRGLVHFGGSNFRL